MFRVTKHYHCPYCGEVVVQWTNSVGPNFCTRCHRLFHLQREAPAIPAWTVGVLAILVCNIQLYT
ncbi:MAG TPA: hypothetical protein VJL29_06485 [Thermoguttaceae bacterium]|nr:hypothetical protein [Thermoguttaceae bacterium]